MYSFEVANIIYNLGYSNIELLEIKEILLNRVKEKSIKEIEPFDIKFNNINDGFIYKNELGGMFCFYYKRGKYTFCEIIYKNN